MTTIDTARLGRRTLGRMAGAALVAVAAPARAQLPATGDKPVRLIVPLAAGSTVDALARATAPAFGKATGHPVVVENLPGAGGISGTTQLVRAAKDGLTLAMISSNHVINPGIYKTVPYDTLKDITPIAVLATVPLVLVVNNGLQAKSLRELLAHARARPGTLNYGSAGNGSTLHLAGELLIHETGIDLRHVPYRGTGPLITDLIGGQVQMAFVSVSQIAPHIRSGAVRALAVTTAARLQVLPEVPSLAEAGVPGYSFDAWIALVGPAGLPAALVEKYAAAIRSSMATTEAQAATTGQGLLPLEIGPDEAPGFFRSELAKHQKLVKLSGATLD